MTILATVRRAAALAVSLGFAALLSGCLVMSETPLVPESEAVNIMPDTFKFVTYSGSGPYTMSEDQSGGGEFIKAPDSPVWANAAGEMKVYFVPRADGSYLVNIISSSQGETGVMYGIARIKDDILELRMVLGGNPTEELAAAGVAVPAGVTIEEGAITAGDRAGLEAVLELMANGTIKADPLISYVGTGTPPATIVADGDWYKAG
jgi:hypothetical protein